MAEDDQRRVPRTDAVLADPKLSAPVELLGRTLVKSVVKRAQQAVRDGALAPERLVDTVLDELPPTATSMRPVINATGVLLHTNLGRAPLSSAARDALLMAAGPVDVELDLQTGRRAPRGIGAIEALTGAVATAEAAHVVNNGAAALALCVAAMAAGREVVISRGELVEIGDGFRIPELLEAAGATIREVGTTNRTSFRDYEDAVDPETGFVLKVHPSNFVVSGFTRSVPIGELTRLPVPVVVDIGSGLLVPRPDLPHEPDATSALGSGAALVTASGDKLLGGPQAGLIVGRADLVQQLRRHPIARALRADKLVLAALEATLIGPPPPVIAALDASVESLHKRADVICRSLAAAGVPAKIEDSHARVGGGGAPGVTLPSVALALPERYAGGLRCGRPAVLGHVEAGDCLVDLRSVAPEEDEALRDAVLEAARRQGDAIET